MHAGSITPRKDSKPFWNNFEFSRKIDWLYFATSMSIAVSLPNVVVRKRDWGFS